jgi:hypothetical protein
MEGAEQRVIAGRAPFCPYKSRRALSARVIAIGFCIDTEQACIRVASIRTDGLFNAGPNNWIRYLSGQCAQRMQAGVLRDAVDIRMFRVSNFAADARAVASRY